MKQKTNLHTAALTDNTTIKVRFSEVDSMQIVWHGEYVRYFEDGRESFGKHYGLGYMDIYREGYMVPKLANSNKHCRSMKKSLLRHGISLAMLLKSNSNMYSTGLLTII